MYIYLYFRVMVLPNDTIFVELCTFFKFFPQNIANYNKAAYTIFTFSMFCTLKVKLAYASTNNDFLKLNPQFCTILLYSLRHGAAQATMCSQRERSFTE